MKKVLLGAVVALGLASPALAGEARIEARSGVFWEPAASINGGTTISKATAGVAAGYDFDLGNATFAGLEVSGDKVLNSAYNRVAFGFTGRFGAKVTANDRLFAAAGYSTKPCELCVDAKTLGAGYEHAFGPLYGKVEYRHFFTNQGAVDSNAVVAGVGLRF